MSTVDITTVSMVFNVYISALSRLNERPATYGKSYDCKLQYNNPKIAEQCFAH